MGTLNRDHLDQLVSTAEDRDVVSICQGDLGPIGHLHQVLTDEDAVDILRVPLDADIGETHLQHFEDLP